MIQKFSDFETYNLNGTILFSDLKDSSLMWKDYPRETLEMLDELNKLYEEHTSRHNGMIVKTIGDAFMIHFKSFRDSIMFSDSILRRLISEGLRAGEIPIITRIGICYGPLIEKEMTIQGANLKDYFGNTVNSASRLESKVAGNNGFAFAVKLGVDMTLDEIKGCHIQKIQYSDEISSERKRSSRLLTDEHFYVERRDLSELKGIDEILVYKCDLIL